MIQAKDMQHIEFIRKKLVGVSYNPSNLVGGVVVMRPNKNLNDCMPPE
jgi:hypothetical protein